jgi:hypothetical protein
LKDEGGCGQLIESFLLMADYSPANFPDCPVCQTKKYIKRNFALDKSHSRMAHTTLGSIADKNTDKTSNDEKAEIWRKHHEYLLNREAPDLPDGMKFIDKNNERFLKPPLKSIKRKPRSTIKRKK